MLLIDHLHSVGDYGQHMNGIPSEQEEPVNLKFCAAACLAAITLLQRMTEDLEKGDQEETPSKSPRVRRQADLDKWKKGQCGNPARIRKRTDKPVVAMIDEFFASEHVVV